ncbi:hypothetical protein GEV27_02100 [Aeromicrobium sp. S22]|uniref:hypothetical protein n=1 Tax=Aeromicrobium sp. S22 TaxID=2662029 RepID=UPI00129EEE16|nr:hypothetical protein [Aeromicrobium sp. S22]MRK00305.1 hypothetical protein [Aeromicrobium sp. S22]
MRRGLATLLVAVLTGATGGLVVATGPAAAAACPQGAGVTVVVGSSVSCDANGGGTAASNFGDAGHALTYVQRQPGAVCKVDGAPSDAGCVNMPPATAYWGLFWSDGTSGSWTYASQGVGSLSVPAGGWVAFVFQNGDGKTYPGVKPLGRAPSTPAKPPVSGGGSTGSPGGSTSGSGSGGSSSKPSATPGAGAPAASPSASTTAAPKPTKKPASKPTEKPSEKSSATPTAAPSAQADVVSDEPAARTASEAEEGSGSLGWVAGILAVALLGGTGLVLWRRKVAGGLS